MVNHYIKANNNNDQALLSFQNGFRMIIMGNEEGVF